jgi:hypothetical protein
VRAGADAEKVAAALEKILRKECDLPVSLAVQEVERDVYVLSGKYEAKPLADRKKNQIEVYGFQLTDRTTGGGGSGTLQEMATISRVSSRAGSPSARSRVPRRKWSGTSTTVPTQYSAPSGGTAAESRSGDGDAHLHGTRGKAAYYELSIRAADVGNDRNAVQN